MKRINGAMRNTVLKFSRFKKLSGKTAGGNTDSSALVLNETVTQ